MAVIYVASIPMWDTSLPQYVNQSGYKEQRVSGKLESKMDSGPMQMRSIYTATPIRFTVRMTLTNSQTSLLDTFFYSVCKNGTETFIWMHPRTHDSAFMRFVGKPPGYASATDDDFHTSFTVEILP